MAAAKKNATESTSTSPPRTVEQKVDVVIDPVALEILAVLREIRDRLPKPQTTHVPTFEVPKRPE